ncbi:hypothetical protein CDV31_006243 [Fusarium ambrosium]|uniref:Uncharacterized protein n=1 Tax=Fusarium ambrosium TaxID=131363 RepID=A0A428UEF4_9HYPO|nr:hypothetical protein CDV31_006243 [Fusarium ambrosium]
MHSKGVTAQGLKDNEQGYGGTRPQDEGNQKSGAGEDEEGRVLFSRPRSRPAFLYPSPPCLGFLGMRTEMMNDYTKQDRDRRITSKLLNLDGNTDRQESSPWTDFRIMTPISHGEVCRRHPVIDSMNISKVFKWRQ